jgi:hypothetical protein
MGAASQHLVWESCGDGACERDCVAVGATPVAVSKHHACPVGMCCCAVVVTSSSQLIALVALKLVSRYGRQVGRLCCGQDPTPSHYLMAELFCNDYDE